MTSAYKKISSLLLSSLLVASSLAGCGGGRDNDTDNSTGTAEVTTGNHYLSTIHIDIGTEPEAPEADAPQDDESGARLPLTLDAGAEYINKFTFICDFQIYGLKPHGMLSAGQKTDAVITGRGGSFSVTSENAVLYSAEYGGELTVSDFVQRKKPEYLLLSLGAQDAAVSPDAPPSDFRQKYVDLIKSVKESSPNTTVICMSVLPGSMSSGVSIYDAERYNTLILSAAEETGTYYLDITSAFAASDGYLRADCDGGSSRLSTTGLKKLLDLMRTHCAEPREPDPPPETE